MHLSLIVLLTYTCSGKTVGWWGFFFFKKVWLRKWIRPLFEKTLMTTFHLNRCHYSRRPKRTCLGCDRSTANKEGAHCLVREWRNFDRGERAAEKQKVLELLSCRASCFFCSTQCEAHRAAERKNCLICLQSKLLCVLPTTMLSLYTGQGVPVSLCCLSMVAWKKQNRLKKQQQSNRRGTAAMSQREIPVDLIRTCCSCCSLFIEFNGPCPAQMTLVFFSVAAGVNIQSSWGKMRCANELISRRIPPLTTYAPLLWHISLS